MYRSPSWNRLDDDMGSNTTSQGHGVFCCSGGKSLAEDDLSTVWKRRAGIHESYDAEVGWDGVLC